MKLNRRGFLRVTGLTALLAAFGAKLPEAAAAGEPPAVTADVVVPSTGRIKIEYKHEDGDWTTLDESTCYPGCRCGSIHKFQHALNVPNELALAHDGSYLVSSEYRRWLLEYYASSIEAEMLEAT